MRGEPGGKGDRRRKVLNQQLADIGEALWREKDPIKREELALEWERVKKEQIHHEAWRKAKKLNPHLWGEEE